MSAKQSIPMQQVYERLKKIRELYATIPEVHCKRLCGHSCGPIVGSRLELRTLENVTGVKHSATAGLQCSWFKDGGCSAYDNRPAVCRIYGASRKLSCPHGCEPDRWMTAEGEFQLLAQIDALGHGVDYLKLHSILRKALDESTP